MSSVGSSVDGDLSTPGDEPLRQSLYVLLQGYHDMVQDFYQNLLANYDTSTYDQFEWMFIKIRYELKAMLMSLDNPYYLYIQRSQNRTETVDHILTYATQVAGWFQSARESGRLERSNCTDSIENLIYSIRNLQYLISR
jgi:hypothetical protein